jgi:hypothetical protein
MARFRYQFTLRQLIKLVALADILLALLRTPAWPFILASIVVIPGFAIDRNRGGKGILGAMLSGMMGFLGIGAVVFGYEWLFVDPSYNGIISPFALLLFLALMGLIWGLFFGFWAWLIVSLLPRQIRPVPLQSPSCGPIYWRDLDARNGMTHP